MSRWLTTASYSASALVLWAALFYLMFWRDVGAMRPLETESLLTYVLLVAAPAVTFVQLARWLQAPLFEIEGTVGWSALGFIVTFIRPDSPPSFAQFLMFVVALLVALATVLTVVAHLVGIRLHLGTPRQRDLVRSRRQGYLAAFYMVSLMVLNSIGTLSLTSAAMLLVIIVLLEMLALAHGARGGRIVRFSLGPRSAQRRPR